MYVMYAESNMASVVNTTPHFENAMGNESTAPPTIVAIRLNVPTKRFDGRSVESKDGAK